MLQEIILNMEQNNLCDANGFKKKGKVIYFSA